MVVHCKNPFDVKTVINSLINSRGANVSHNIILKPLRPGVVNITAAMVTYQPSEEAEQQV